MKTDKISTEALDQALNAIYVPEDTFEWNGLKVIVRRNITFAEMLEFVEFVTSICFAQDTNAYLPEVRDYAIKLFVLEHYANFELPKETERKYAIVYKTDLVSSILNLVDPHQFNDIIRAIDIKLDYMAESNIEALTKTMNEAMSMIENFGNQFSELFGDMTPETMAKFVDTLAGGMDESKLVDAYFEKTASVEKSVEKAQAK